MKVILALIVVTATLVSFTMPVSSDQDDVAARLEALRVAMIDGDRAALEELTWKELSYGHSSGKIESQREFVDVIASGRNDFRTLELSDHVITVVGDVAIVRHTFVAEALNNGELQKPRIGVMQVWKKDKKKWKLLGRQAFKL